MDVHALQVCWHMQLWQWRASHQALSAFDEVQNGGRLEGKSESCHRSFLHYIDPQCKPCQSDCPSHDWDAYSSECMDTPMKAVGEMQDTLLHEMIHAYLFTNGQHRRDGDHGPRFRAKMQEINCSAMPDHQVMCCTASKAGLKA